MPKVLHKFCGQLGFIPTTLQADIEAENFWLLPEASKRDRL
jgi:hypothetical protein